MPSVMANNHVPVMVSELLEGLAVIPGGRYVDCTVGAGGHAAEVLEAAAPGGRLIGLDADPRALRAAERRLEPFRGSYLLVNENFSSVESVCRAHAFFPVNGVYFDLGLSSLQLGEAERGFSFQREAPLDMRFSDRQELTAADIVNQFPVEDLARVLWEYGEEPRSRAIARRIVSRRPIRTTTELARLVEEAAPGKSRRIHPATRTFQALRIRVNDELGSLERALEQALVLLGLGGRIVVISYHSLEDRIVKRWFQREASDCICPPGIPVCVCGHQARLRILTRRVVTPSADEVAANPRSRSARLRVAERV